jgi:hypothetical protein
MEVLSACPLPVTSLVWRRTPAAWVRTVACKGTFDLVPGVARLSKQQDPLHDEDQPQGGDPSRSVHAPGDRVPFKPRADVVLVGSAFAPGGQPVRSLVAVLAVGAISKAIEVFGARVWTADGQLQDTVSFSTMSLAYERAAGGPDTWNPVGVRLDARPGARAALPNLQPVGQKLARRGDFLAPIGFGPIAASWPLRAHLLGSHGPAFGVAYLRERPMPEDLDPAWFNAAPPDQQLDTIQPDEAIVLENLHRDHPRLSTRLPGLAPCAQIELPDAPPEKVRMRADTLWIDTDRAVCTVTWRAQIPLRRRDDAGRVVVTLEAMDRPEESAADHTTQRRAKRTLAEQFADEDIMTQPLNVREFRKDLPFVTPPPSKPEAAPPPAPHRDWPDRARAQEAPGTPPPPTVPIMPSPPIPIAPAAPFPVVPPAREVPRPPPLVAPVAAERETARGGVLGASNAAAIAAAPAPVPAPERSTVEAAPRQPTKPDRDPPREALDLIWYDPAALPRVRRNLAWKKHIADLKPRPSDEDFDGGLPPDRAKAAKDRRDVFGVLARGQAMDMDGIRHAMEMAVLDDGSFVPPYVLAAGALEWGFDEKAALEATLLAAAPFVPGDRKLKEAADAAYELLKTPGIERARGVLAAVTARVKAAFVQPGRTGYLDEQVEAMLLEGRSFRRTTLLGGRHLTATFAPGKDGAAVTAYLAEEGEHGLPPLRRFDAKLVAEARIGRGPGEIELVVVALGRRIGAPL